MRPPRRAGVPRRPGFAPSLLVALAALAAGCGRDDRAFGDDRAGGPPPGPPAVGPWFVDRAADFGLDAVTRLGDPDKPSVLHAMGTGVALLDYDGDGDLDLFVLGGSAVRDGRVVPAGGPWLFRNDGPGRWADATEGSGLAWTGWAQGVAVADYDGDGRPDLFVAQHGPDTLWRNVGDGTFVDATESAGLGRDDRWGVSAAWADVDGDGHLDLYVANYLEVDPTRPPPRIAYGLGAEVFAGPTALPGQPDTLWRNNGNGTFVDTTESSGLLRPEGKGMAAAFADVDGDGRPDLYVTNDTQPNALFRNLGDGRFEEVALDAGVAVNGIGLPEGSMGIAWADVDGDGRPDLAFSNFRHEGTRLYRNLDGRRFLDISGGSFVGVNTLRFVGWGIVLADLDDDGRPDLFQVNGHVYPGVPDSDYDQPAVALRNVDGATFKPATDAWGPDLAGLRSGRGLAAGDLDEDGDLDLVMTTMDGPLRVLINEGTREHKVCRVRLVGRAPNSEAIGARVEVEAGGRTQSAEVARGGSILSASDARLHFGLGDAGSIDRVRVRWPDGEVQSLEGPPADALLTIHQGRAEPDVTPFPPNRPTGG